MTVSVEGLLRVTVNAALLVPVLPSVLEVSAILIVGRLSLSEIAIVPVLLVGAMR